ncbi:MAG: tRNA preQ1(34) S-adenosylmethionine ribosyltransferase-isomerase QueA [Candidatus Zixiibacteriota bacterium]
MDSNIKIPKIFHIENYKYQIDESKIAQKPADKRTKSKLLVLDKDDGAIQSSHFENIANFLRDDDLLVFNNTKVIPARLFGIKRHTGAKIEILLTKNLGDKAWQCLCKPAKRLKKGSIVDFFDSDGNIAISCEILETFDAGIRRIRFDRDENLMEALEDVGHMPLPPYIHRSDRPEDRKRYQTVYAKEEGAVAAPTAGLHFDKRLLEKLKKKGIEFADITLHVGIGTFRPIDVWDIREHKMHSEFYTLSQQTAEKINRQKESKRRVIAVGTTSVRTLETIGHPLTAGQGETDIFIYPPYDFKVVDGMITNFHLPGSSLIVMVSAFAGRDNILNAYKYALDNDFRFFSYGDSMLIR